MGRSERAVIDAVDLTPYLHPAPLVLIISGPSGAGKDATVKRMIELGFPCHFVVTATTRPRRPGEVHGVDYYFVGRDEFERMIREGELIEHAVVYGEYKGIPKRQIHEALASGRDVVMRIDVQGAARMRQVIPDAVFIFLTAPSEEELVRRLRARHTETPEALERRLATARQEMQEIHKFDYVVINREDQLDCTVHRILSIVEAEKSRAVPRKVAL
jgi:guanylate kinase